VPRPRKIATDVERIEKGRRIKMLREASGMRQIEFAEACGVGQSTVSDWQNGKTDPEGANKVALKKRFLVTDAYLASGNLRGLPDDLREKLTALRSKPALKSSGTGSPRKGKHTASNTQDAEVDTEDRPDAPTVQ
jgi:transcriptional regulator with XRE-family HTH domain